MKKSQTKIFSFWIAYFTLLCPYLVTAQEKAPEPLVNLVETDIPVIGHGTNRISMHKAEWTDSRSFQHRTYVCFVNMSGEAIVATATNRIVFLKGKMFAFELGDQSFSIRSSQPTGENHFSAEKIKNFAVRGVHGTTPSVTKTIDLTPILLSEKDIGLAQPLILRDVQPKIEGGGLVVYFESYTHLKGKVVLDDKLDPISLVVISNPVSK